MRRKLGLVSAFLLFFTLGAVAQEHDHAGGHETSGMIKKKEPKLDVRINRGTRVSFPSSPGDGMAYLSLPEGKGKHPAVIVIQEFWGLNEWVMQQADNLAKQGYVALAVDLYRGKATADPAVAHELMRGMPEDRAMADLKAGFNYLAARADVDVSHIGSIGWCMGGGYSLALATSEPRLAAAVINYGRLVTDPATIAKINAPLLGNFGGDDQGISAADVNAFSKALQAAGKSGDMKVYEGAGHGFMNVNNSAGYNEQATRDAQTRIDTFLAKHLHG
jgi:carboxymethylenebutenolidase